MSDLTQNTEKKRVDVKKTLNVHGSISNTLG